MFFRKDKFDPEEMQENTMKDKKKDEVFDRKLKEDEKEDFYYAVWISTLYYMVLEDNEAGWRKDPERKALVQEFAEKMQEIIQAYPYKK